MASFLKYLLALGIFVISVPFISHAQETEYCLFTDKEANQYFKKNYPDAKPVIDYTGYNFEYSFAGNYLYLVRPGVESDQDKLAILAQNGDAEYRDLPVKNAHQLYLDRNQNWLFAYIVQVEKYRDARGLPHADERYYYVSRKFGQMEGLPGQKAIMFDNAARYIARIYFSDDNIRRYRIQDAVTLDTVIDGPFPNDPAGKQFRVIDISSSNDKIYLLFGTGNEIGPFRFTSIDRASLQQTRSKTIILQPDGRRRLRFTYPIMIDPSRGAVIMQKATGRGFFIRTSLEVYYADERPMRSLKIRQGGSGVYHLMPMEKGTCIKNYLVGSY